jgi:hypothetical protein
MDIKQFGDFFHRIVAVNFHETVIRMTFSHHRLPLPRNFTGRFQFFYQDADFVIRISGNASRIDRLYFIRRPPECRGTPALSTTLEKSANK